MNYHPDKKLLFLIFIFIFLNGCTTFEIIDLKPQTFPSSNSDYSTSAIVGVETIQVIDSEYRDASGWQQGLADALRDEGVFKSVSHPYINKENVDILFSGEVGGEFRHHGAKNFFTWWPGPFIFAHNWRGTHFIYDARADIVAVDAKTGDILGKYHAESSHELIHQSNNPGPLISALVIIPGVIKGGMSVSPREKYRQQMYEVAYPNLWKKIAIKIGEDQAKIYSQRIASLEGKCGKAVDEAPEVGVLWFEFTSCQTRTYRLLGQELIESDVVSVYIRNDRYFRVHVSQDGRIVRWYVKK